ncbi:MAG: hypothetical protein OXC61_01805, partial [Flavobacteriaceae bacterium]|nr:hypothetical protein [Flavobacteriaceae bacterium]
MSLPFGHASRERHRLCFDRIAVDRSLVGIARKLLDIGFVAEEAVFFFIPALVGRLKSSVWRWP